MDDLERTRRRWQTRRRMAWWSFGMLIAMVPAAFLFPEAVAKVSDLLKFLAMTFGGIVGAYIGFATQDDVRLLGIKQ